MNVYYMQLKCIYNLLQDGDTSLLLACREGMVDVVKVLLQAGADKKIQNKVRDVCMYVCMYV